MHVVVTGACGFIGHHLVEHLHKTTDWKITILDRLSYASKGLSRLRDTELLGSSRVRVFTVDLANSFPKGFIDEIGMDVDYIVHMAAETHVDNSITEPVFTVKNNVMSTVHTLEWARSLPSLKMFLYFSTDEVFGPALNGHAFKESERHTPTNPYSASKSAAEQICIAYENTYKVPVVVINVMNAFGERQHVEKFIPKCIKYVKEGRKLFIHSYADKRTPGSRFYIHGRNIASAVLFIIKNGKIGENYNVTGEAEVDNLTLAQMIAEVVGKPIDYELVDFHSDRPGHDLRYSLDGSKLAALGWAPPINFKDSLRKTVQWTLENSHWLNE